MGSHLLSHRHVDHFHHPFLGVQEEARGQVTALCELAARVSGLYLPPLLSAGSLGKLQSTPGGWLIPIGIMVILSFPPVSLALRRSSKNPFV